VYPVQKKMTEQVVSFTSRNLNAFPLVRMQKLAFHGHKYSMSLTRYRCTVRRVSFFWVQMFTNYIN